MVRDARWLIPLAQSLTTDELAPYFEVAQQIAETLRKRTCSKSRRPTFEWLAGI